MIKYFKMLYKRIKIWLVQRKPHFTEFTKEEFDYLNKKYDKEINKAVDSICKREDAFIIQKLSEIKF